VQRVGELCVRDRLAEGLAEHRALDRRVVKVELDRDDDAAQSLLQHRRAIAELELGRGHAARGIRSLVEEVDRHEGRLELLPVGADVLHWRGADRARDARERLEARVAVLDGPGDEVVPVLAGLHANANGCRARSPVGILVVGGRRARLEHLDAPGRHADHRAVEALVADEEVRAAAEHEPRFAGSPRLVGEVDEVALRGGRHELANGAAHLERREL
jgi:hypothetical protein